MSKWERALFRYWELVDSGMDKVDACVKAINSVANTWYEYARIYNTIKEAL